MRRIALLLTSLFLALLLAEMLIRLLQVAPEVGFIKKDQFRLSPNPNIGYEPIPSLRVSNASVSEIHRYNGVTNKMGFRDEDYDKEKPSGTKRIIILGDSIAAGQRIPHTRDIFPSIVEKRLNKKIPPIEVLNFGVIGYNTQQEVETLIDKGIDFNPDLVVLAYCLNDRRRDDGSLYQQLLERRKEMGILDKLEISPHLSKSALYRWIKYHLLDQLHQKKIDQISQNTVRDYFERLSDVSIEHKFDVLVCVFPYLREIDAKEKAYPYQHLHEDVKKISEQNKFHHLDLLHTFRSCKDRQPKERLALDKIHPTALGHQCAAETISDTILKNIWNNIQNPKPS
ncbi:hypothetical protein BVX98_02570 [bacterium F11]|nr:hypothetical protein BVX98_02570 [bacterium F11]